MPKISNPGLKQALLGLLGYLIFKVQKSSKDSEIIYLGHASWFREGTSKWVFEDNKIIRLHISPKDSLPFLGILPEGKIKTTYLTFTVDKASMSEWEWLKIKFIEYNGRKQDLIIERSKIKPEQIIWDDRIWEVIP